MAKKQRNNNKPKQRKAKPKRTPKPGVPRHLVMQTCGVTDPFCAAAFGSKWPDTNQRNTLPYTVRGSYTLSSDANGLAATLICPGWTYGYSTHSSITGTTATMGAMTAFPLTSLNGVVTGRLVCGGVQISRVCSNYTASGRLIAKTFAGSNGATNYTTVDITNYGGIRVATYPLPNMPQVAILHTPGGTDARGFQAANASAIASVDSNNWDVIFIGLSGCPASTAMISVEYVYHFEVCFSADNAMAIATTKPPAENSIVTRASGIIQSKMGTFFEGATSHVVKTIENAAVAAVSSAATAVFGPMGGYAAQRIGQYAIETD